MSRIKLKEQRTEIDNLIGNLRGEIGEIIFTWILMKDLLEEVRSQESPNIMADLENPKLIRLRILIAKLRDEIISRLSELAQEKIGRLNFYFAGRKLNKLSKEISDYECFIKKNNFKARRDRAISHKELPERWQNHKANRDIPYRIMLTGIAKALRLMKKIDDIFLGPCARYLWREMRKRRYVPLGPIKVGYLLLPYLKLSKNDRTRIINEEIQRGRKVWESIDTIINGQPKKLMACKKWGALVIGNRVMILDEYPLIEIKNIEIA